MKRISQIGSLLKRIYRIYSGELLLILQNKGFTDLRPSFLEVLLAICEKDGPSIKEIGLACGLKKQTMTSHLNELENRGYISRTINPYDKREQNIHLTEYGQRFKFALNESINQLEQEYSMLLGEVELERFEHLLTSVHTKMTASQKNELPLEH
ncbi:MAG: hypothetical protein COW00_17175 [Bdellovibrio sp. CG12_big_fil_rev_8_21_14_0_65_39_13]|nr:MAG: hypothetical protein COW78_00345 [Bdellovibrio sp. CG22_combo_CG10-13_8_21_14_all_39_27]PIQ58167.1 MAG: hypothetical protein COW00_17175 [Bdellovibrio sp. CG12_big_fil_rev_8_21_14_0_65_39_13]PIR34329.1 MAG: hypothetical protein COV37_13415 [Bdellovibrio sp. CG11_big_fil_rev_8_21_14_0_20_39_38]PJB52228.1 MAG: hypothetical protein CO099_13720 [Bdellovibrio sp. CG_4_9_14_3_um_filter_39_7]